MTIEARKSHMDGPHSSFVFTTLHQSLFFSQYLKETWLVKIKNNPRIVLQYYYSYHISINYIYPHFHVDLRYVRKSCCRLNVNGDFIIFSGIARATFKIQFHHYTQFKSLNNHFCVIWMTTCSRQLWIESVVYGNYTVHETKEICTLRLNGLAWQFWNWHYAITMSKNTRGMMRSDVGYKYFIRFFFTD